MQEPIQRPACHSVIGENGGQGEDHSDLRCELCAQAVSGAKVVDGDMRFLWLWLLLAPTGQHLTRMDA